MNIPKLLKDRGCGFVRVIFTTTGGDNLQSVMSRIGFQIGPAGLYPIDGVEAEAAFSRLFLQDLAHGAAVMDYCSNARESDCRQMRIPGIELLYKLRVAGGRTVSMESGFIRDLPRLDSDYEYWLGLRRTGRRRGLRSPADNC